MNRLWSALPLLLTACLWIPGDEHDHAVRAATPLDLRLESIGPASWAPCEPLDLELELSANERFAGQDLEIELQVGELSVRIPVVPDARSGRAHLVVTLTVPGPAPALDAVDVRATLHHAERDDQVNASLLIVPPSEWFADQDRDGSGGESVGRTCTPPDDAQTSGGDCDDLDPARHPAASELCDGLDTNCDGDVPAVELDADLDGWSVCEGDCDDAPGTGAARTPFSVELCNQIDDDCDDGVPAIEIDGDGDGWLGCDVWQGDPLIPQQVGDCVGDDPAIHPAAFEACNGLDDDCDQLVPSEELDHDGDGRVTCQDWTGDPSLIGGDCDDLHDWVFPGALEVCDGLDTNCDGAPLPDDLDGDLDGWLPCSNFVGPLDPPVDSDVFGGGDCADDDPTRFPGAVEICNALDDDCDATLDEGLDGFQVGTTLFEAFPVALAALDADQVMTFCADAVGVGRLGLARAGERTLHLHGHTLEQGIDLTVGSLTVADGEILVADAPTPTQDGGAFTVGPGATLVLRDVTVIGGAPQAPYDTGGCVFATQANLTFERTTFQGCQAGFGGAVHATGTSGRAEASSFQANHATASGGALFLSGGSWVGIDALWQSNTAAVNGGAISASGGTDIDLTGASQLLANEAGNAGGAAVLTDASITATTTHFEANQARYGGGVYCDGASEVVSEGGQWLDNHADDIGGAFHASLSCSVALTNAVLHRNTAPLAGGMYLAGAADLTATTCDFGDDPNDNTDGDVVSDAYAISTFGAPTTTTCTPASCSAGG